MRHGMDNVYSHTCVHHLFNELRCPGARILVPPNDDARCWVVCRAGRVITGQCKDTRKSGFVSPAILFATTPGPGHPVSV